ncbi:glutamate-1-semialdehyde 2,1-aminomutase [Flavobacterium psychrophilum]|uniref:glutamate-1-semialdehyde 2,1-aminomutase n=1 Tax=Flavobacterium psychrophilum TaxID=96345 RepID=UPI0004F70C19|nr:glutamate-1-semialdehyde 2,1-aminomutase [Flavobacterium psychrophilum]AIN73532.1 glutamate-1-semialdehyde aminotransferase [Flavobacterium psychrophilum FPG3]EKT2070258.1 glutamate-1-semialdehyde 2,1-aminomutase [Flavobacterium psychrophilum]EKT2072576.1 glutamate-1-semialdehyde 2,1-aminomutase [Flavobacterium psychrophilum]EKT4492053.1 glutamate-1-semialdehyde 2,1-aminomutase [Flavobacterium psychrophilum]MBF2045616.1 glutamate-1-semialdehyde 2,1-aminomutase [Flavobacterium psychrophilum]
MLYKRSSQLFLEAEKVIPGGVNSPVRAFKSVGGTPIFAKSAKGAYVYDEDGNRFVDYINSWGPMILGHAYEPVVTAVIEKAKSGTSFGMPTELETEIAKLAVSMVSNIDKIRFVNSGTEACMSAIRLARGFTKRDKIIKFAGCYHGHSDSFLIQAGSGAITFGSPNSPGVTSGTAKDTLLASYNDIQNVKNLFDANKNEIAAVIIEPVAGNMGCIPPRKGFLEALQQLCHENNALLIFDEVMTGFRLAKGGAQELFNVQADIVCFGKVIGGGLPVGAFAARNEIMNYLAPLGPVYQAGTLSGNPLAMAAGLAMLKALNENQEVFARLEEKTAYLAKGIADVLTSNNVVHTINRVGSMVSVHFDANPVFDFETAKNGDNDTFKKFFHGLLAEGVYIAPSAYETWFISDALTYEDLDFTIRAVDKVSKNL